MLRISILLVCTLLLTVATPIQAQNATEADELLAFEKLREQVESAYLLCTKPPEGKHDQQSGCIEAAHRLAALGPEVIPFMENEISQEVPDLEFIGLHVLGLLPSEQTAGILKDSIQRYDRMAENERTRSLKLYALLALAVQGDPAVIDLANSGRIKVGLDNHLYLRTPALAIFSILVGPESLPRLTKQIEMYGENKIHLDQLLAASGALAQVAEPGSFDTLSGLLSHPEWPVRLSVIDGFRRLGDNRSVDRLIAVLNNEPDRRIRVAAAHAMARLKPAYAYDKMLAVLEKEPFPPVRGLLYRTIADIGGADAVPDLFRFLGSPTPDDRRVLITALGWTGSPRALQVIKKSLQDEDGRVPFAALDAMNRIGTPGAVDSMLSALHHQDIGVATTAAKLLAKRNEPRAAPRILSRLKTDFLDGDAVPKDRDRVKILGQALVDLRYTEAGQAIQSALTRQTDPIVKETLLEVVEMLSLIETNGNDLERWAATLKSENHETESLAIAILGRIGTDKAVDLLLDGFEEFDLHRQMETVNHLNHAKPDKVAALLEEIMISEQYDTHIHEPLHATAAWTAARIGGERMSSLLLEASTKDKGSNMFYVLYLMKAMGDKAIPHLEAIRVSRLKETDYWRWQETKILETVADDLKAGVHNPMLDTPPEEVEIQHL